MESTLAESRCPLRVAFYDTKPYDREYFQRQLRSLPLELRFFDFRLNEATAQSVVGCDAVCIFVNDQANRSCLEVLKLQGVKLITLRCAGYNNVDLSAARDLGLNVVRVPAYSPHAVAEHAVALLLTLNRKTHRAYNRVREHNFSLNGLVGFDLHGKSVGVVGTGKIGKIMAQILAGFGSIVRAYDPIPDAEWADTHQVTYCDFETLLESSDILTLHLPLTAQTHHLLNGESLAKLKPGAIIVNTSRGKLIDTTALIKGLRDRRIGGVALDVYEEEEGIFFEDHSDHVLLDDELNLLLTFPNVLVTSHQAFLTSEALGEIARVTLTNLGRLQSGEGFLAGTILV